MLRRSVLPGVCVLALVVPLLPLLGAGCTRDEARVRLARHGVGRAVYKQLVAVSRGTDAPAPPARDDEESEPARHEPEPVAEAEEAHDAPEPAPPSARNDVPPDSWVAAFPAPDATPLPAPAPAPAPEEAGEPPEQKVAAAPAPEAAPVPAPARVRARVEPEQPEPVAALEAPQPELPQEPQVVVFVPGGNGEPAAQIPQMPAAEPPPVVNLVVVAPIIALQALLRQPPARSAIPGPRPSQGPQFGARPAPAAAPAPAPAPPPAAARVLATPRIR